MYRPTVRYDDCFKEYVDSLFQATTLDRNQIMRLALYLLGHTKEGKDVLTFFSTSPIPDPLWERNNHMVWYGKPLEMDLTAGERDEAEGGASGVSDNKNSLPGYDNQLEMDLTVEENNGAEGGASCVFDNENRLPGPKRTATRREGQVHEETQSKPIIFRVGNSVLLPKRG